MTTAFEPRRVPADLQTVSYTDADGSTHTMRVGEGQTLKAPNAEAEQVLDSFGFRRAQIDEPKKTTPKKRQSTKKRDNAAIAAKAAATRQAKREQVAATQQATREVGEPPLPETNGAD